jgi:hypothetical protein
MSEHIADLLVRVHTHLAQLYPDRDDLADRAVALVKQSLVTSAPAGHLVYDAKAASIAPRTVPKCAEVRNDRDKCRAAVHMAHVVAGTLPYLADEAPEPNRTAPPAVRTVAGGATPREVQLAEVQARGDNVTRIRAAAAEKFRK